ncbi:MAG TPA: pseudouridine synthase [Ignavibacteriaceae bacterium]|nr:pseudouridine synthase [Ignavibacteriaceae bacterium]
MNHPKNRQTMIRLNKFIADSGITSRRKSEELILQGRISVNNKIIKQLSFKVDPENDEVFFDGEKIAPKKHLYFLLNKPKGVVTTTSDEKNRMTVIDIINSKEKIFPVGRLDYNTTGVLILTNDGDFSNLLTHPSNHVPRTYQVTIDRDLEPEDEKKLLKGVFIDGVRGKFKSLKFTKVSSKKGIEVVTVEGRNHFVKNMFKALGYTVTSLNRSVFGNFEVDIPVGTYRPILKNEIKKAIETYG